MRSSFLAVLALTACGNGVPTVGAVTIDPASPRTDEPLTATATGVSDPDGDPVSLTWAWTVNGNAVDEDGDTLSASAFVKGDQVVATDLVRGVEHAEEKRCATPTPTPRGQPASSPSQIVQNVLRRRHHCAGCG